MGEKIRGIETPKIPSASIPQTDIFREVHEHGHIEKPEEELLEQTRNLILQKYNIGESNVFIEPLLAGKVRKIRAFVILGNKEKGENFYAEGHTLHNALLNQMVEKFSSRLGITELDEIVDEDFNIKQPWETRKGFLDPQQNGFKSFPQSREALISQLNRNRELNGVDQEEVEEIKNGNHEIPNWFLTGLASSK